MYSIVREVDPVAVEEAGVKRKWLISLLCLPALLTLPHRPSQSSSSETATPRSFTATRARYFIAPFQSTAIQRSSSTARLV